MTPVIVMNSSRANFTLINIPIGFAYVFASCNNSLVVCSFILEVKLSSIFHMESATLKFVYDWRDGKYAVN